MSRDDYIQHAHRHHPTTGTDPLPVDFITDAVGAATTAGLPVCYAYTTSPFTVTADGAWHAPDWDYFKTNNTSAFSLSVDDHSLIHFAAGYYLVGYQVYMATLPTAPDYVASIVSETGSESGTVAGRGIIGDWVKANTVTADYYSAGEITAGLKSWQNVQLFQLAPDAPTAGGFYRLLFEKDSGANATLATVLFYAVRLSGAADAVGSTGGIFFDTDNIGDWLQIVTTANGSEVTTPFDGSTIETGISLLSTGGNLFLGTTTGGGGGNDDVYIDSGNDIFVRAGPSGNVFIDGQGAPSGLFLNSFGAGITVNSGGFTQLTIDGFELDSDAGISINQNNVADTQGITITDSGTGGINFYVGGSTLALQIQADGTIHALSGGSIHFDL